MSFIKHLIYGNTGFNVDELPIEVTDTQTGKKHEIRIAPVPLLMIFFYPIFLLALQYILPSKVDEKIYKDICETNSISCVVDTKDELLNSTEL